MAHSHQEHTHQEHKGKDPLAELRAPFLQEDGTYRITGDEIIGDTVAAFPKVAAVMLGYGLHCVGCSANSFDTVADGARLHGIPEEDVQQMLRDLNAAINKKIEMVEMTAKAIVKVKELRSKEEGKADWPLRIAVMPGGCAGFSYEMDFDQPKEGDLKLTFDDLHVLVDPESVPLLKGSSIDYVESLMGSGFKIENPNASRGCGCGKSFG
jgi:iron-sulfur cluster assembly protein